MKFFALVCFLMSLSAPSFAADEGLDPSLLLKPATDSWPTFNGDYSGRRFSPLTQINKDNVNQLTLAWAKPFESVSIKSMALQVNGILYFTVPDNVWAVDARTGGTIWHYMRPSQGDHIGQRGVGMYKTWLYFETPDCHLISLDAKDGKCSLGH